MTMTTGIWQSSPDVTMARTVSKGNRFGFFPSGSLGWAISEEEFFSPVKDLGIFDYFKVRGSYGEIGLNGAKHDDYAYLTTFNYNSNAYVIGGSMVNSITPGLLPV